MRKIISFLVCFTMMVAVFSPIKISAKAAPNVSLEKAMNIAKQTFNLTTNDYDFTYSYSENQEGRNIWNLQWNTKKQPSSNISVSVDSSTGDIVQMYRWDYTNSVPSKLPKYSKDQALKAAKEWAQKIQPAGFKETRLFEDKYNQYGFTYYSPDAYSFRFIRQANGIDFPDNGITIVLDKNTLKIVNYSFQWDKGILSDPSKAISTAAGKQAFIDKLGIELSYKMIYDYENQKRNVMLVYALKDGNYAIDALTGKVLNSYYRGGMPEAAMDKTAAAPARAENVLTPEEKKSIEENSKLITKEQALEIAKKYLPEIESYKLSYSNLYIDTFSKRASWDLSWNKEPSEKGISGYANVRVDALNSDLISFSISGSDFGIDTKSDKPKISKTDAKAIADKFIKDTQPEKFKEIEYRDYVRSDYEEKYSTQYSFSYVNRLNNAVVSFNNFSIGVDAYTGRVTSYYMNWENDIKLPATEGIMTLDKAYDTLFEKGNFSLKYFRYFDYQTDTTNTPIIKLAYALDNVTGMMDPKTGAFLDYNGKPVKEVKKVEFTDIKGHAAENNINLLSEMNIIDSEGGKFNPNSVMLQKDLIKLIVKAIEPNGYVIYPRSSTADEYENYYRTAIERKIITEKEKNPNAQVTRLAASKMFVRALNIGFVADMPNLYTLNFKDSKLIANQYKGYVAITSQLGIIAPVKGNFEPSKAILRGDAATMIVNLLKVDVNVKN
jgi:hypothetical protein